MKFGKRYLLFCIFIVNVGQLFSQETASTLTVPEFVIKTNLLSDIATTFNLGVEFKTASRKTFNFSVSYNPWEFSNNKKMKHILVQPEMRHWFCNPFNGHYVGLHAHYAFYNVGGIGVTDYMKEHRFEGWLVGGGISYGYHWILSDRWSIEANIGVGYAYLNYDLYPCDECGDKIGKRIKHYIGPTQLGVSLIYVLK